MLSDGSQAHEYGYDAAGNRNLIRYLDAAGNPVLNTSGYAELHRLYNEKNKIEQEWYCGTASEPVNIGIGYQCFENEFTSDGKLSLSTYYDAEGIRVPCGSSYFHEYLAALKARQDNGAVIFLAVKDEGTSALTPTLLDDLRRLGIRTDLSGKYRHSYCAVITPEACVEDLSADQPLTVSGVLPASTDGGSAASPTPFEYTVASAGYNAGNYASILINGTEYAKNVRGMNIVVMEDGRVTESVAFDTCSQVMAVTR